MLEFLSTNDIENLRKGVIELHVQTTAAIHVLMTMVISAGLITEEAFAKAQETVEARLRQKIDQESAKAKEERLNEVVEQIKHVMALMGVQNPDETAVRNILNKDVESLLSNLLKPKKRHETDGS
ncbi:MAG: hypothetical protein ABIK07_05455 [Planctomycetota bacterium]